MEALALPEISVLVMAEEAVAPTQAQEEQAECLVAAEEAEEAMVLPQAQVVQGLEAK
jgi:hypothetical protein